MPDSPFSLPGSQNVDVARLARVFDDTTQCYKFLFFQALLDRFNHTNAQTIPLVEILAGMIEAAWWPVMHYRLTIGVGSGVHRMRQLVEEKIQDADERFGLIDVRLYATNLANEKLADEISRGVLKYVPTRFLKPWIANVPDRRFDVYAAGLTREEAVALNLPYRLVDRRHVALNPNWADYFAANMPILKAWADLHWLGWMQARNPNISVSLEKLGPPPDRKSLARQTAFLKAVIAADCTPLCIFTGEKVDPAHIALDHFLPRSFICHDRIWNLVPITPEMNSRKGARLPWPETIDKLAAFHSRAIDIAQRGHAANLTRYSEEYATDLRLDLPDIRQPDRLADAYRCTVGPLLTMATRMGFPAGWP